MGKLNILTGWRRRSLLWRVIVTASLFAAVFVATFSYSAHAATTLPTKMNFQGRITNSAGNILANGTYNMRFKIYNALTSGTLQWSEDRLVSATQGVTVTNGQFNVQLGSVTSLPASIFASNSLYFEVELPTPATATTSSPVWTEGPMSPRNQLATSAYAYNAETLDGIDGSSFAQLSTANAFTNTNSISVSSANAFQVKNGATNLFNVDTSGSVVTIGQSDTTAALFVLDTKTNAGDPGNVAGAMYYNSSTGKFRCYQVGWTDCIGAGGGGAGLSSNNTFTGTNTFQNTTNSTSAFAINNQSAGSLFKVDTTNAGEVTILGNSSGETGSWATATNALPAGRYGATSIVANGYVYVMGGNTTTTVYYAKLNTDGSVGTWLTAANALPAGKDGATSIVANGYVYVMGGNNTTTVYYAKLNADGSVGAWQTNANALPAARSYATSIVANGYVYVMGGNNGGAQSSVYYAKLNADGSVGTWSTAANALPVGKDGATSIVANGYVYVIGGGFGTTVYYAKLNADGSVGTWSTAANALPGQKTYATSIVANGYVYTIAGTDSGGSSSTVYYAKLNADGSVGAWQTNANALPAARSYATSIVANGYAYVIGGDDGSTFYQTVYYSRLGGTLKVGGNLDLVGLQGQNLADGGSASAGSTGGSITAGNIIGVGSLQIQGEASFASSATVTGNFSAGNGLFAVDTGSTTVRIGSSVADATGVILVLDTKNTAGDPTGTNGAMYYNSNAGKFRCYQAGAWTDCIGTGGGGSGPTTLTVATNQATTATTFSNVTGLTMAVTSGYTYTFRCNLVYTTAVTTTALRVAINGPTATNILYSTNIAYSATAESQAGQIAYDTALNPGTGGGATRYPARIAGAFTTTANGTFAVRFNSEISASTVTILANSYCTVKQD